MSRVKDKILRDAEIKALEIADGYRGKAEEMRSLYADIRSREDNDRHEKNRSLYEMEMNRLLGARRLEMKRMVLEAKRDLLKELASSVKGMIRRDPELYRRFIEKAVSKGVVAGEEEIVVNSDDRKLYSDEFISRLNSIASETAGVSCTLKLSEKSDSMDGGLHLAHGRTVFNSALSATVDDAAEEYEPELADILFKGV